jgi:phospho-N-acetylmuramoyl-pentapeptide-transferase
MELTLIKVLTPAIVAFLFGIAITPIIAHYLYTLRVWKKRGGKTTLYGNAAEEFNKLKGEGEVKTPRMGGLVIVAAVALTLLAITTLTLVAPTIGDTLNFLSRGQTWIPVATFFLGALVGFLNDFYDVTYDGTGLRLSVRLTFIALVSGFIGWWFYAKLGVSGINIPGYGLWELGLLVIPFFVLFSFALYASGVIDGIDGLSGGVFSAIFTAYAFIAFLGQQFDLAAFCAMIVGAIIAFLWFNIPPARFWMTETGSMALTMTLAVVVFMTDSLGEGYGIALFFVVGLPLIATVASNVIQMTYRRCTGRKLFRIAPLHHHFEAIGWPSYKVTMRYWVISMMCALLGVAIALFV